MILNLIVIAFILGMAVLWASYGLFSALLQLALAIAAGAIAFAVWEPVTVNLLLPYLPDYAWAAGLILPFVVAMLVLRVLADKLITGNMKFPGVVDQVLGGAVGALSGVVSAGVALIGIAFLPLPLGLLGYQPYEVKINATVGAYEGSDQAASLWIPADRVVSNLYGELSRRGFSSARPLATVYPDLMETAYSFRLGRFYDENATLVAVPDTISVSSAVVFDGDLPAGMPGEVAQWFADAPMREGDRLVVVGTEWVNEPRGNRTFDENILRVPPYQAKLLARDGRVLRDFLAIGWSQASDITSGREFFKVDTNTAMAFDLAPPADIAWVYAIPAEVEPEFVSLRNVRLPLPEAAEVSSDADALLAAVGRLPGDAEAVVIDNPPLEQVIGEQEGGFANHRPVAFAQTASLARAISPNDATGLDVEDGFVIGGKDTTSVSARGGASAGDLGLPASLRPIRLRIEPQSAAGQQLGAGSVNADIWLEAANGNQFKAIAYSWLSGQDHEVSVQAVERTTDLPLNAFREGDTLYLYFQVPPNIPLAKYHVGQQTWFAIDWTVEPNTGLPRARRR